MNILIGLLIIAVGAFCQSSSYVPINKIRKWSWESYWLIQGVFAWLIFPVLGALLAVPQGHGLFELYAAYPKETLLTMVFGVLWGVGGLTFGLSMRYLGVALGQSIALGTCAGLGTIMGPVLLDLFFPELNALASLTHKKYIPATPSAMHTHINGFTRLLRNRPKIGTANMYRVVKKPDLPTPEEIMPTCCKADAAKSTMPQRAPPKSKSFEKKLLYSLCSPAPDFCPFL